MKTSFQEGISKFFSNLIQTYQKLMDNRPEEGPIDWHKYTDNKRLFRGAIPVGLFIMSIILLIIGFSNDNLWIGFSILFVVVGLIILLLAFLSIYKIYKDNKDIFNLYTMKYKNEFSIDLPFSLKPTFGTLDGCTTIQSNCDQNYAYFLLTRYSYPQLWENSNINSFEDWVELRLNTMMEELSQKGEFQFQKADRDGFRDKVTLFFSPNFFQRCAFIDGNDGWAYEIILRSTDVRFLDGFDFIYDSFKIISPKTPGVPKD